MRYFYLTLLSCMCAQVVGCIPSNILDGLLSNLQYLQATPLEQQTFTSSTSPNSQQNRQKETKSKRKQGMVILLLESSKQWNTADAVGMDLIPYSERDSVIICIHPPFVGRWTWAIPTFDGNMHLSLSPVDFGCHSRGRPQEIRVLIGIKYPTNWRIYSVTGFQREREGNDAKELVGG